MESNHVTEAEAVSAVNTESTIELEGIKNLGLSHLKDQLSIINGLLSNSKTTVTYEGFRKALTLALTHEVLPDYVRLDLVPKQQLLAAHLAKAIELVNNLKTVEHAIKIKNEDINNNEKGDTNVAG